MHSERLESRPQKSDLISDHLRAHSSIRQRIYRLIHEPLFIGKADVVELHFAEPEIVCFLRQIGRVLPNLAVMRIEPWMSVLVQPGLKIVLSLDRPLELG